LKKYIYKSRLKMLKVGTSLGRSAPVMVSSTRSVSAASVRAQVQRVRESVINSRWFADNIPKGFRKYYPEGKAAAETGAKDAGSSTGDAKPSESASPSANGAKPKESTSSGSQAHKEGGESSYAPPKKKQGSSSNSSSGSANKESKGGPSGAGGAGGGDVNPARIAAGVVGFGAASLLLFSDVGQPKNQISWQEFRKTWLPSGKVVQIDIVNNHNARLGLPILLNYCYEGSDVY
jgi:hypothetical protein